MILIAIYSSKDATPSNSSRAGATGKCGDEESLRYALEKQWTDGLETGRFVSEYVSDLDKVSGMEAGAVPPLPPLGLIRIPGPLLPDRLVSQRCHLPCSRLGSSQWNLSGCMAGNRDMTQEFSIRTDPFGTKDTTWRDCDIRGRWYHGGI